MNPGQIGSLEWQACYECSNSWDDGRETGCSAGMQDGCINQFDMEYGYITCPKFKEGDPATEKPGTSKPELGPNHIESPVIVQDGQKPLFGAQ